MTLSGRLSVIGYLAIAPGMFLKGPRVVLQCGDRLSSLENDTTFHFDLWNPIELIVDVGQRCKAVSFKIGWLSLLSYLSEM